MLILLAVSCDRLLRQWNNETEQPTVQPIEETALEDSEDSEDAAVTSTVETIGDGQAIRSDDINIQMTFPSSWSPTSDLHESAELQAADLDNQLYLIVVAEESPALRRLGLRDNAENYRQLLHSQLAVYEGENPTEVAFIDDEFASQYEIRGRLADDTPVVYLHTTVVTQARYYQIVAWAPPEQYEAYRSELQNITVTFREIDS